MNRSRINARIKAKLLYVLKLDQRLRHWDDERYLKLLFRIRTGKRLDLDKPETFSEKLQWLKINDRRPEYTTMVDKYDAKRWVADRIGESHVVPDLGVWNSFDEVDFSLLPEQFVLKSTHDSGGLVICRDRSEFDAKSAQRRITRSLSRNYYHSGREWPYRDVRPRVLAEVYLPAWVPEDAVEPTTSPQPNHDEGVVDYKFYCFHGEPKFLYVSLGLHDHGTARMDFLTLDWMPADFSRSDYMRFREPPPMPQNLPAMVAIAQKLSADIPFVRVDLFEHFGKVLFSEMTFHPVSGMMPVEPMEADYEIGRLLDLSIVEPIP